jgi:hypothetical protein
MTVLRSNLTAREDDRLNEVIRDGGESMQRLFDLMNPTFPKDRSSSFSQLAAIDA